MKSVSAAKPKRVRAPSGSLKSESDKFLRGDKLLLIAAGVWEELWLISNTGDLRAIDYSPRVDRSQTNLGIETWKLKQIDWRKDAKIYREQRTFRKARELLDDFIVNNKSIEDCATIHFGSDAKLAKERTRQSIRVFLQAFAGLIRLPGAN
jgi:hypothetical protein